LRFHENYKKKKTNKFKGAKVGVLMGQKSKKKYRVSWDGKKKTF